VGREYIKLSRGYTCRPLSMKISSPKAINWTLKQYGYSLKKGSVFSQLVCHLLLLRLVKTCPAALPGSLARQPCPAALPVSLARQPCPAALPGSLARHPCPASMPGILARHPCPASLPGILARHPCPASLPGNLVSKRIAQCGS
jgi:hypothetical protein